MPRRRFEDRLADALPRLSPTELRMAQAIAGAKERVVLSSAVQISELASSSDATLIRTVRALGYETLAALREDLLGDLIDASAPSSRLERTLGETGAEPARVLSHVSGLHRAALDEIEQPAFAAAFADSVDQIATAAVRHVFGIGPSGALADYAALQMNRIGYRSTPLTRTGVALADQLAAIAVGDAVIAIAYAPLYREIRLVLDRAEARGVPVILISDSLGPLVGARVATVLPVPRGRADHLALHGGTFTLIEALVLALAARDPARALDTLDDFASLRAAIDPEWRKRGTRRRRSPEPTPEGDAPDALSPSRSKP